MKTCPDCGALFEPPCAEQDVCGGCEPEAYEAYEELESECLEGDDDDGGRE